MKTIANTVMFTHYVYNRNGRCLAGVYIPDGTPEQVVAAYLEQSGGKMFSPPTPDTDNWGELDYGALWFGETLRGKGYNRYVVRSLGQDWPKEDS